MTEQVEKVYRIGIYEAGKNRPMKVRFATQTAAEYVLERTGRLAKMEEMKQIWIKKDMKQEET